MSTQKERNIRDEGLYSARNTVGVSLVEETGLVVNALATGFNLKIIRQYAIDGLLFRHDTRHTRRTLWQRIYYRQFAHKVGWVVDDLKKAYEYGSYSPEFTSFLYVHYALSDRLTYDFVINTIYNRWVQGNTVISRDDILLLLDEVAEKQPQVLKWTDKSRRRLASTILGALRNFGVLKGVQKKEIIQPVLPLFTAEHILRILTFEGKRGDRVLSDSTWKLFFLTPDNVAQALSKLAQNNRIRFEQTGDKTVLETPSAWDTLK